MDSPFFFFVFIAFITMFVLCFFGWEACGILAPQTGIEPSHPAFECEVLLAKILAISVTEAEFKNMEIQSGGNRKEL